jgi:hypothetical protein
MNNRNYFDIFEKQMNRDYWNCQFTLDFDSPKNDDNIINNIRSKIWLKSLDYNMKQISK